MKMKIAAVIVTYNRLSLLKEVLDNFDHQTRLPDYVIVVDNASTDGTGEYLVDWEKRSVGNQKIIITSESNVGGSGGFYFGTKKAVDTDADWIWVSDDDAVPALDVFERAEKHIGEIKNIDDVSAVCTSVWTNNRIALSNRSRRRMTMFDLKLDHVSEIEYKNETFECDNFSYVGVLMNRDKLKQVGLIKAEYFIWRDDVEHSWRLSEAGKILCFPDMVVNHKANAVDYDGISWKTFYAYRNDLLMLKEHVSYRYQVAKKIKIICWALLAKNQKQRQLYWDAIREADKKKGGINRKYLPGNKYD